MVIIDSNTSKIITRTDVIDALHIQYVMEQEQANSQDAMDWHEQVEEEYYRKDEKEALDRHKAIW